jgi:murein DD-endopeptidase MepM/ murein hydrolase activator NlpD
MGNKNTAIQFLRDKGFYIALAVCIVGAAGAAWATASRTLDSIEENNRQIVEQGISGEEKPSWSSSSTSAPAVPDKAREEEEARKDITNTEKPPASSISAPSSSLPPEPSGGSAGAVDAPVQQPAPQTFVYTLPLEGGKVTGAYSAGQLVKNKTLNVWRTHDAVDLAGEKGTRVLAVGDGTVAEVTNDALWGGVVRIDHPDGYASIYSGLVIGDKITTGTQVKAGQEIGTLGDIPAEISAETHLHFTLMKDGKAVDPGEVLTLG